jgi:hypothetical protein
MTVWSSSTVPLAHDDQMSCEANDDDDDDGRQAYVKDSRMKKKEAASRSPMLAVSSTLPICKWHGEGRLHDRESRAIGGRLLRETTPLRSALLLLASQLVRYASSIDSTRMAKITAPAVISFKYVLSVLCSCLSLPVPYLGLCLCMSCS